MAKTPIFFLMSTASQSCLEDRTDRGGGGGGGGVKVASRSWAMTLASGAEAARGERILLMLNSSGAARDRARGRGATVAIFGSRVWKFRSGKRAVLLENVSHVGGEIAGGCLAHVIVPPTPCVLRGHLFLQSSRQISLSSYDNCCAILHY